MFIHSPTDGHIPALDIVNNAAVNMDVQVTSCFLNSITTEQISPRDMQLPCQGPQSHGQVSSVVSFHDDCGRRSSLKMVLIILSDLPEVRMGR